MTDRAASKGRVRSSAREDKDEREAMQDVLNAEILCQFKDRQQCMTYLIECIEYSGVLLIRHVVVGLVLVL